MENLRKNAEGYNDPTAYGGIMAAMKEEQELQSKVKKLVSCLKLVIDLAGFDLTARIHLKHRKTGKEFY
jgi:hypothetical protein